MVAVWWIGLPRVAQVTVAEFAVSAEHSNSAGAEWDRARLDG